MNIYGSYYLLDNLFIKFGSKLYRQTVCISMGTNCALLAADLLLLCYERDLMLSISKNFKLYIDYKSYLSLYI